MNAPVNPPSDPRPRPLGDPVRHLQLLARMARVTGADPATVAAQGGLSQEEWVALVTRCRQCQWADRCARWLHAVEEPVDQPPQECRNRQRIARLARGVSAS